MFDCDSMSHQPGVKEVYERERSSSFKPVFRAAMDQREHGRYLVGWALYYKSKRAGRTPPSLRADDS